MIVVVLFPWVPLVVPSSTPSKATEMHLVSVYFMVVFLYHLLCVCVCAEVCACVCVCVCIHVVRIEF